MTPTLSLQLVARLLLPLALLAARAPAAPLISEVLYDAAGSDDGLVFVELWGAPGTSLEGLVLEGVNGSDGSLTTTLPLDGAIPADGIFVVADGDASGITSVPGADQVLGFDFQNGPDSIRLVSGVTVLDALGYGGFGPEDVFAGEGSPAVDPPAGSSLARLFANLDSDDNASDFVALEVPTPGSAPLAAVPEPGTGLLVGLGLGVLAAARRTT